MKCMSRRDGKPCGNEGTLADPESPPIFLNPENPTGPTIRPVLCRDHYDRMMRERDENEASWRRAAHLFR